MAGTRKHRKQAAQATLPPKKAPREYPPGTLAIGSPLTGNAKLGKAATTYAAQGSCPTSCRFFNGGGCYAEHGKLGQFITAPLNRAAA